MLDGGKNLSGFLESGDVTWKRRILSWKNYLIPIGREQCSSSVTQVQKCNTSANYTS